MMQGANVPEMARMQAHVAVPVVASGGVTTLDDVKQLAEAGMAGAIIGRALYENTIDLTEAIQLTSESATKNPFVRGAER
jgi:phosphoribosylformimino-5-aminoimidazole carboxamide ribotide isomerase